MSSSIHQRHFIQEGKEGGNAVPFQSLLIMMTPQCLKAHIWVLLFFHVNALIFIQNWKQTVEWAITTHLPAGFSVNFILSMVYKRVSYEKSSILSLSTGGVDWTQLGASIDTSISYYFNSSRTSFLTLPCSILAFMKMKFSCLHHPPANRRIILNPKAIPHVLSKIGSNFAIKRGLQGRAIVESSKNRACCFYLKKVF